MWLHHVDWLSWWYIVIGLVLFGIIFGQIALGRLTHTRLQFLASHTLMGWAHFGSVAAGVVVMIVSVDHPVEISFFYLYLVTSVLYPGALFVLAMVALLMGIKKDMSLISRDLAKALESGDEEWAEMLLPELGEFPGASEEPALLWALCHDKAKIRKQAKKAAQQCGVQEKITACVTGKNADFGKLAKLGNDLLRQPLVRRAERLLEKVPNKKVKARPSLVVDALSCLPQDELPSTLVPKINEVFLANNLVLRKNILRKLYPFGDACESLVEQWLESNKGSVSEQVGEIIWTDVCKGALVLRGGWQQVGQLLWTQRRNQIEQDLCCASAATRTATAKACASLQMGNESAKAIQGNHQDFVRLALLGQTRVLVRLLNHALSSSDSVGQAALLGVASVLGGEFIPAGFVAHALALSEDRLGEIEPGDASDESPEEKVPPSEEVIGILRVLLEDRVELLLCHSNADVRKSMAQVAGLLQMDGRIQEVIQGDLEDFERLVKLDSPPVWERLEGMAASKSHASVAAAQGFLGRWKQLDSVPAQEYSTLSRLVCSKTKNVRSETGQLIIDLKSPALLTHLLLCRGPDVGISIARFMLSKMQVAAAAFGEVAWPELKGIIENRCRPTDLPKYKVNADLVDSSQIDLVDSSQIDPVDSSQIDPVDSSQIDPVDSSQIDLVDSSQIVPSGGGDGDFQEAIAAINSGDKKRAEALFRSAVELGLDTLRQGYARVNIGVLCVERGALEEALKLFEGVLAVNPVLIDAAHDAAQYLAVIYQAQGRTPELTEAMKLLSRTSSSIHYALSAEVKTRIERMVRKRAKHNKVSNEPKKVDASDGGDQLAQKAISKLTSECVWHHDNAAQYDSRKAEFARREREIIRPLGEELHLKGGLALMRKVYAEVEKEVMQRCNKGCSSALEMKWNGVGDWRS